jgi:hypothetical protein
VRVAQLVRREASPHADLAGCARLVRELAAIKGTQRWTELIYCRDRTGPATRAALRAPITATTSTE